MKNFLKTSSCAMRSFGVLFLLSFCVCITSHAVDSLPVDTKGNSHHPQDKIMSLEVDHQNDYARNHDQSHVTQGEDNHHLHHDHARVKRRGRGGRAGAGKGSGGRNGSIDVGGGVAGSRGYFTRDVSSRVGSLNGGIRINFHDHLLLPIILCNSMSFIIT